MTDTQVGCDREDRLGQIVDEFFEAVANGETPDVSDYLRRYPEIADLLKIVIPAMLATEQAAARSEPASLKGIIPQEKQLGDFRILRQIGRGGMGIVYEAEQISMKRRVALKVLPLAGLVDEIKIRRFQNEVRAVAALNHPNIVPVYMVGEERGVHYYAMQLIRGRSLSEVISSLRHVRDKGDGLDGSSMSQITSMGRVDDSVEAAEVAAAELEASTERVEGDSRQDARPMPGETVAKADNSTIPHSSRREYFRSVAALGIQAATALQHAHDEGVIHRDIKPANLLLDRSAKLYVTDFGLARIEADAGVTMTGDVIGTLRYMAPEQALGKRVVVDHRADIYSLAATLYELMTLRPAYLADDRHQLLKQIAFEEPTPLRRIDRDIPVELETIVHKAMSKDMNQRYASAQELADDLRAHLENRSIKAKPPTTTEIIGKWTRRNPALTWATIITLSFVTMTLAASTLLISKQLARATIAERETKQASEETARQAKELALRNYLLHIASADNALRETNYLRAQVELDACQPQDQQRWEWKYLAERMRATFPMSFPGGSAHMTRDGKRLVKIAGPRFSPDDNCVKILDLESGKVINEFIHDSTLWGLAVSNNGQWIVCGDHDGDLIVWNAQTGKKLWSVNTNDEQGGVNRVLELKFSPDGRHIAAAYNDRRMLVMFDAMNGEELLPLGPFEDNLWSIVFSPDSRWIACRMANDRQPVMLINAATRKVATKFAEVSPGGVVFSPDSRWMATVTDNGKGPAALIDVATGTVAAKFSEKLGNLRPTFDATGQRISTANVDGSITVWNWDGEQLDEVTTWHATERELQSITFNADGTCLASTDNANTVNVWNAATGKSLATLENSDAVSIAFRASEVGDHWRDEIIIESTTSGIRFWRWWNNESGTKVNPLNGAAEASFSPDGQLILVSTPMYFTGGNLYYHRHPYYPPETAAILNAASGLKILTIHAAIYAASWSPDGREIIATPASGDAIRTYDVATGEQTSRKFPGHSGRFTICRASSNGKRLVSFSSDNTVRAFDYESGEEVLMRKINHGDTEIFHGAAADFSPDASLIRLGEAIWDTRSVTLVSEYSRPGHWPKRGALSDDGKHVYVGRNGGLLTRFNIETQQEEMRFYGHTGAVLAIAIDPEEKQIVAGDTFGRVIVWDVLSGQPLVTLTTGDQRINSLDWSSDGRRIVAGKEDGTVQIWTLPSSP